MGMAKFPAESATSSGLGPINSSPSSGQMKFITIKNLGPEVAWIGPTGISNYFDNGYPLPPGELITFATGDTSGAGQYKYSTYGPGATLWVWES